MTSNVNGNLSSISFPVNSSEGWVCGGDLIRHYTSSSWSGDQDYPSGAYNAIHFVDNNNGWAVGDNGIIIHTNDGENWSTQQTNSAYILTDVFFLNTLEGWAVGSGGTILHTTNGGSAWSQEGTGLTASILTAVHFVSTINGNVGYIVGNGKALLKYGEILGIGDTKLPIEFELFPNPVIDILQIKCSDLKTENRTIQILSMDGKEVLKQEIEQGNENIEIDVSNLISGVYFCTMKTDKKSSTKKLIIE
jgi:photosystem II stability/assembly factor-like uncharacterized protein